MADKRTNQKRLNRINKMLKESFNYNNTLSMDSSNERVKNLRNKAERLKQKVVENSEYNTYHKSKDYNKALLIMEACDIVSNKQKYDSDIDVIKSVGKSLKESESKEKGKSMSKTISSKEKIAQLESLYESYVEKNGQDEKSKELNEKLTKLKKQVYKNDVGYKLKMKLSEDTEKAEAIMAAQGLLDDILNHQAKIGEMLNETLDSFVQKVNAEYSSETGDKIREKLNTALNNILNTIDESKTEFYDVVNMLSENGEDSESMVDKPDVGSLEDDESNEGSEGEEDLELDTVQDQDSVEGESDESEEDSEESDFDIDLDSESFERREE